LEEERKVRATQSIPLPNRKALLLAIGTESAAENYTAFSLAKR